MEVHVRDQCEHEEWMYQTWNRQLHPELSILFSSSFKSFFSLHYYHVAGNPGYAELSVIYAVHCPCHGSPYEPYLEDQ